MRFVYAFLLLFAPLSLSGCALGSLSGNSSQFNTVERVVLSNKPSNFVDGIIDIGKAQGYQYSGSDRQRNQVTLTDQPNLGQDLIGSYFRITVTISLLADNRTVELRFIGVGNGSSAGEEKSTARLSELKSAIRNRWN